MLWLVKAFAIFLVYPSPKSCWLLDNMHLQDLSHVGMKPSGISGIKQKQFFVVHFVKNWLTCVMDSNGKISGDFEGLFCPFYQKRFLDMNGEMFPLRRCWIFRSVITLVKVIAMTQTAT